MKLYAGNLAYQVTDADLKSTFEEYGTVDSATVIMDRDSGKSKGFGFVEMSDGSEAKAAMAGLDGKEVGDRAMKVSEARPREDRGSRGGGNRGGGGYRGGGNRF